MFTNNFNRRFGFSVPGSGRIYSDAIGQNRPVWLNKQETLGKVEATIREAAADNAE